MKIFFGIAISLLLFYTETQGQTWLKLDDPKPDEMVEVFKHNLPDENARKIHGRTYFNPYPELMSTSFLKHGSYPQGWCTPLKTP